MNPQASPSPSPSLGRRVATVLGVLAICLIARWIPVPTIPLEAGQFVVTRVPNSIIALGVKPLIGGYVLVELAALLVPVWRSWRTGGAVERAKLARASLLLGLGLSLFQAVILNDAWQVEFGLPTEGRGVRAITLIGTVFLQVGLAKIVDREGLGSGLVVVLLATILPEVTASFGTAFEAARSGTVPWAAVRSWMIASMLALGALVWLFKSSRLEVGPGIRRPFLLGRPACGLVPITLVGSIMEFVATWTRLRNPELASQYSAERLAPAGLVLSLVAAAVFAYLFHRPARVAEIWRRLFPDPPEGVPELKSAIRESVFFIGVLALLNLWMTLQFGAEQSPYLIVILFSAAILYDLFEEWRFRSRNPLVTSVWEIHQVYAIAPALRMLDAEGIQAFAKGSRFRSLTQFFAPYAPVQILVPIGQAPRAHSLFQTRWLGDLPTSKISA